MSPSLARLIVVESSVVAGAGRCRGAERRKSLDRRYIRPNRSRGVRVTENVARMRSSERGMRHAGRRMRHPERRMRHPERRMRHPERRMRHPERRMRHPERSEGSLCPKAASTELVGKRSLVASLLGMTQQLRPRDEAIIERAGLLSAFYRSGAPTQAMSTNVSDSADR